MNMSVSSTIQTMASWALRSVLVAATGILLARTLQPEGQGIYAVITTTALTAIAMGHLSLGKSQIALWPDAARRPSMTGNALIFGILLGVVSAFVTYGIVTAFVPLPAPHLLVIALFAVPLGVAATNLNGILLLQSRTGAINRAIIVSALLLHVPILVLACTGTLTTATAVVCWTVSAAAPFLLLLKALGLRTLQGDVRLARRQLALSGRYHVGVVALHLLVMANVLLLNTLVSAAEVGLYMVAMTVQTIALIPTDVVAQVILARQAVDDEHSARRVTARALRINLLLSSVVACTMAIASPFLIPLVYGAAFTGSVVPLICMAPGVIAFSLRGPVEQYLVRLGRPMTMAAIPVAALLVTLGLDLVMIPWWGATGVALASSASFIAMTITEIRWFARVSGVGMRDLLFQTSDLRYLFSAVHRKASRSGELSELGRDLAVRLEPLVFSAGSSGGVIGPPELVFRHSC
jgi:O-antigen/teichoic acid export membrane protein